MRIGVFDSGVGGLTVLKEIKKIVPSTEMIYVGDSANIPYGNKTKEELYGYVSNIISFLEEKEVDFIVFACNTATSMLLQDMKKTCKTPLLGVIDSGVNMALQYAKKGIGIIATPNTIETRGYECQLELKTNLSTYGIACHELVNGIEKSLIKNEKIDSLIKRELKSVPLDKIDTLILGCTHFPIVEKEIQTIVGEKITLVNPAIEVAREVLMRQKNLSVGNGKLSLLTSGSTKEFQDKASYILGDLYPVHYFKHKKEASKKL